MRAATSGRSARIAICGKLLGKVFQGFGRVDNRCRLPGNCSPDGFDRLIFRERPPLQAHYVRFWSARCPRRRAGLSRRSARCQSTKQASLEGEFEKVHANVGSAPVPEQTDPRLASSGERLLHQHWPFWGLRVVPPSTRRARELVAHIFGSSGRIRTYTLLVHIAIRIKNNSLGFWFKASDEWCRYEHLSRSTQTITSRPSLRFTKREPPRFTRPNISALPRNWPSWSAPGFEAARSTSGTASPGWHRSRASNR